VAGEITNVRKQHEKPIALRCHAPHHRRSGCAKSVPTMTLSFGLASLLAGFSSLMKESAMQVCVSPPRQ
jgi:hypothetical protein